ncbi:MAG: hypothetical protein WCJ64_02425 [Rhodospirillaceae bacterium]
MTIHQELRRFRADRSPRFGQTLHDDIAADAAELAVYETARALGYLTTQAARIAASYGRSLNI